MSRQPALTAEQQQLNELIVVAQFEGDNLAHEHLYWRV
jgi:hypothetical protein